MCRGLFLFRFGFSAIPTERLCFRQEEFGRLQCQDVAAGYIQDQVGLFRGPTNLSATFDHNKDGDETGEEACLDEARDPAHGGTTE